jgi:hypothetical protein
MRDSITLGTASTDRAYSDVRLGLRLSSRRLLLHGSACLYDGPLPAIILEGLFTEPVLAYRTDDHGRSTP